jgi:hypothetical protein
MRSQHLQVKFNISTTFSEFVHANDTVPSYEMNMDPLCNIMDLDIKRGMDPFLTADCSPHAMKHLKYWEIYSHFLQETSNVPHNTVRS